MTEKKAEKCKGFTACFANMPEMMRSTKPKLGGSCCSCVEMMTGKMPECCSFTSKEASPAEKPDQDGPK